MSLLYKLRKIERTYADGRQDPANGKWYARTVYIGERNLDYIAERVSYSTTVTKADCYAVIKALIREIDDRLSSSYKVKLDGLGTFYTQISSNGAVEKEEFTAAKNIRRVMVRFQPSYTVDMATGELTGALLKNLKFQETVKTV
ncbi:MAG: HU family DNA-binding protein [Bacteroidales bacterium]|nr:HU family DNA-binding protein [Bacteroidales bacterium]